MKTCLECGDPIGGPTHKKFCGEQCRYRYRDRSRTWDYKRKLTCADCGKRMYQVRASLPQGQARCHGCRRRTPSVKRGTSCVDCARPAQGERCKPCYVEQVRAAADPQAALRRKRERNARARRERAAPGLNTRDRRRLLAAWKREGRRCTYCLAPAEQVDHVIPLALGGTNHEGNLAPACRSCNVRKGHMLVVEWKHRKMRKRKLAELPPPIKMVRKPKVIEWAQQEPAFNICPGCGGPTPSGRAQWCSSRCNARTNYRRSVGIPDRAPNHARAS